MMFKYDGFLVIYIVDYQVDVVFLSFEKTVIVSFFYFYKAM